MSMDTVGMLLTHSQELHLLNDQEVTSVMQLIEDGIKPEQPPDVFIYDDPFHQSNELMPYGGIPNPMPPLLPSQPSVISNEEYEGPYNFDVFIDHCGSKNPWVYSSLLNKLFITMKNPIPVDFKWDSTKMNLYVRATPLFSLPQYAQECVTRCSVHSLSTDESNRNVPEAIRDHVIRCQSDSAQYLGSKENNKHLNVIVPLETPQAGMDTVRLMYTFMCQNSCPSGMNRKPIEVIFTLEDENTHVYGRRKLNVRVCSCPKRDKEKEEKEYQRTHGENGMVVPKGKKRKIETQDKKHSSLFNSPLDTTECTWEVTVLGKHNLRQVAKYAYDLMAGELARHGPNPHIQRCLTNLEKKLKSIE